MEAVIQFKPSIKNMIRNVKTNLPIRERLETQYSLSQKGMWEILGEKDPNSNYTRSHYETRLEFVTGTYANVINYALTLDNFVTRGYGGSIVLIDSSIKNVDDNSEFVTGHDDLDIRFF